MPSAERSRPRPSPNRGSAAGEENAQLGVDRQLRDGRGCKLPRLRDAGRAHGLVALLIGLVPLQEGDDGQDDGDSQRDENRSDRDPLTAGRLLPARED